MILEHLKLFFDIFIRLGNFICNMLDRRKLETDDSDLVQQELDLIEQGLHKDVINDIRRYL